MNTRGRAVGIEGKGNRGTKFWRLESTELSGQPCVITRKAESAVLAAGQILLLPTEIKTGESISN